MCLKSGWLAETFELEWMNVGCEISLPSEKFFGNFMFGEYNSWSQTTSAIYNFFHVPCLDAWAVPCFSSVD